MAKTVTIEDVLSWGPCEDGYPAKRIRKIAKETKLGSRALGRTLLKRLRGRIPDADLIWLLCHEPLLGPKQLRLFACDCASRWMRREARAGRKPYPEEYKAVRMARRFVHRKATSQELREAYYAASGWYCAVARSNAAWAAREIAEAASFSMTGTHAAKVAELEWQLKRLEHYLT